MDTFDNNIFHQRFHRGYSTRFGNQLTMRVLVINPLHRSDKVNLYNAREKETYKHSLNWGPIKTQ